MGFIKKFLIFTVVLLCAAYLLLYLALPYFLNKKDYSTLITENVQKQTGLILVIENYKLKVSPNLDVNLKADNVSLFYPDKKQISNIKKADIDISTIRLLKKEIKIDKIEAEEFQFSGKILKNGKLTLQEYLEKNLKPMQSDFAFSSDLPKFEIDKYIFKIKDEKTNHKIKISGKDFKVSQNINFSYLDIVTDGGFYSFDHKIAGYKIKFSVPKELLKNPQIDFSKLSFENLGKYNFYADLNADLKIFANKNKFESLVGKIDVDKFSVMIGDRMLPPSYFHVLLEKNKAKISSEFYTNINESTNISADIKTSKPYSADIKCKCPKANIANLKKLGSSLGALLKIKNNLDEFSANGTIKADFAVKTDFKSMESDGSLEVINANISHKKVPLKINGINALVDFSNNSIKIKKSDIFVNGQPIKITGTVDKNANGNLLATAENLDLNHIMNAFPMLKPQKNLVINSGKLSFKAKIQGKLSDASPQIYAVIKNFSANEKTRKIKIAVNEILIDAKTNKQKYAGTLTINDLLCTAKEIPNSTNSVRAAIISAKFDEKDFKINPSKINLGNAKMILSGEIKDYAKTPAAIIMAKGTIDTSLIKSFVPKSQQNLLFAKGYIPVNALITERNGKINVKIQALANPNNYVTPIHINNFAKTNTLTQIEAAIEGSDIVLNDFSIYYASIINSLSTEAKTANLKKAINIRGGIDSDILENLHITTDTLSLALPDFKNSHADFNADLTVNGKIDAPVLNGTVNLSNIDIPEYFTKAQTASVVFNKNYAKAQIDNLKVKSMDMSVEAIAPLDVMTTNRINYLKLTSNYVDMEYLMALTALLKQSNFAPGTDFPFTIQTGKLNIKSFKMGDIKAQNITADISAEKNLFKLNNLYANAYGGKTAGRIIYNFPYSSITADLQGRDLDAGLAARDLMPQDKQISGKLNFDSSVTMYGVTPEQQIKSLKGNANILMNNAQLGQLGRFEHFLYAQNLLSQRLIYASLASAKQALKPKNTGYVTYVKGVLRFNNGFAYLSPLITSGPQMSMYITGNINLLNSNADIDILGKVSQDVSSSLGIFGSMTIKEFFDEHTKYGTSVAKIFNFCNEELPEADISKIPDLTPNYKYQTKNFRVLIDGDTQSVKAVKSFTWVNPAGTNAQITQKVQPSTVQNTKTVPVNNVQTQSAVPKRTERTAPQTQPNFLDNIPDSFK